MILYFAGLARDCGNNVFRNLNHINHIFSELTEVKEVIYFLLENNSRDNTYSELKKFEQCASNVNIFKLDMLSNLIPSRISRLAYCREFLLEKIRINLDLKSANNSLIFWGDLDDNILSSMLISEVKKTITFMQSNSLVNGVFPFSKPYYYDILALRSPNWQNSDCFDDMKYDLGIKGRYKSYIDNISAKQIAYSKLEDTTPIKVLSAFGGAAIYKASCINSSYYDKSMSLSELNDDKSLKCEHIYFNLSLSNLYILPFWSVEAPRSHIIKKFH